MKQASGPVNPGREVAADSISIIVPAIGEPEEIKNTVQEIIAALADRVADYEILLMPGQDCPDKLAECKGSAIENKHVRVVCGLSRYGNRTNWQLGLRQARMTYVMWVKGEHSVAASELRKIFALRGDADLIIPYEDRRERRPWLSRIAWRIYSSLLHLLFGFTVPSYSNLTLFKRTQLSSLELFADNSIITTEALIRLLQEGKTVLELPVRQLHPGRSARSWSFSELVRMARASAQFFSQDFTRRHHRHD